MMSYIIQRMPFVSVWKKENDSNTLKKIRLRFKSIRIRDEVLN